MHKFPGARQITMSELDPEASFLSLHFFKPSYSGVSNSTYSQQMPLA